MDTIHYQFYAYNELLFLINAAMLPPGTLIHSDSRARVIPSDVQSLEGIEDYSGTITFKFPIPLRVATTMEFIQIVMK